MKAIRIISILISISISPLVAAVDGGKSVIDCNLTVNPPKKALKELYDVSLLLAKNTCEAMNKDDVRAIKDMDYLTGGFAELTRLEVINLYASSFPESIFPKVKDSKLFWSEYSFTNDLQMNTYELTAAYQVGNSYGFSGPKLNKLPEISDSKVIEQHCVSLEYQSCKELFSDIGRISRIPNHFIRSNYSDESLKGIRKKSAAWDKFSDNSRFQFPIDILFTSWIYSETLTDGRNLNFPPNYQYFLLHPSLVIEHFSAEQSGDKDKLGLAVEWGGFNRWDADIPWGISLASVYSDRVEGNSIGHGLMFHIYNNFSFGFANRGGSDNSFYINMEIKDWFGEIQDKYKSYK
ncbi:hypothetical protein A9267_10920 [Shewanella sp. UCD-FRSSP16_17]|uniref:hypothetical protein n=1 Tax=Shewanella sp. UCD-FRSSP16_17 TaxID=1853256 RepID=UPI0007EEB962|nr:hypothetical protein [Shewanella sp. UCD-FRSSP16_17]OBT08221.1 hypothetical protein A9267_10920 [Shewanella sp. UCD-FRSSP16_17]